MRAAGSEETDTDGTAINRPTSGKGRHPQTRSANLMRIRHCRLSSAVLFFGLALLNCHVVNAGDAVRNPADALPPVNDDSAESLRLYQRTLREIYGGDDGSIPLDVKAAHFEWVIARYHLTSYNHVHHSVRLPKKAGDPLQPVFGDDVATWHGALLAALSYKYAVTADRQTLTLIGRLLDGLHFFIEVTGQPGLTARCVLESETPYSRATLRYDAPDGRTFHYRSDAAKGSYNQIIGGYAALMMHVYKDLPADKQKLARGDLSALVMHVIDHKYRLVERDGKKTSYGNLTPIVGTYGIPFNAQVAYAIVAAGYHFPPGDEAQKMRVHREFKRLRKKHHVYYKSPLRYPVVPQRVGNNPFVKGMNDRNHLMNAAFVGLTLEVDAARRNKRRLDKKFVFRLGRTMYWTMHNIQQQRNALCNFMWAGILSDDRMFNLVTRSQQQEQTRQQLTAVVLTGIEQLRRCPIDRFFRPGEKIDTKELQWIDAQKHHEVYFWKAGPYYKYKVTGPPTETTSASIDYLYAFWVMRYYRLYERYYTNAG